MSVTDTEKPAKVTFRVTTYFKRPRGQAGLTNLGSRRLCLSEALDWILAELPGDALTITPDTSGGNEVVTVRIDWAKVPAEVKDGNR